MLRIIKEYLHFIFKQKRVEWIKWYHYFSLDFYIDYVFETKPKNFMNFLCRMKGHPNGYWFYTSYGDEPDYHCKDCGELI